MEYSNKANQKLIVGSIKTLEGSIRIPVGQNVPNYPADEEHQYASWFGGMSVDTSICDKLRLNRHVEILADKITCKEWDNLIRREQNTYAKRLYFFSKFKNKFYKRNGNKYQEEYLVALENAYKSIYELLNSINNTFKQNIGNDGYIHNIAQLTRESTIGKSVFNCFDIIGGFDTETIELTSGIDYKTFFYDDYVLGSEERILRGITYYVRGNKMDIPIVCYTCFGKLFHKETDDWQGLADKYHLAFCKTENDNIKPTFSSTQFKDNPEYDPSSAWKLNIEDLGETSGKAIWAIPFNYANQWDGGLYPDFRLYKGIKEEDSDYLANAILVKSATK